MHLNSKYQLFINGREKVGIKTLKIPKAFIDYSQTINHLYENLEDYNPARKGRVLIVFDDMIADMESNEKLSPIVTELFLWGWRVNISLVFISQPYFKVRKSVRLNAAHYFIMKSSSKRKLKQVASKQSSNIHFKDFVKLYKKSFQ